MPYDLDPIYKQVRERIADLKHYHPDARLRPLDTARPYWIERIGDKTFIVYAAACYLREGDTNPGVGLAWEPFPGTTPYTKNSELQNAETSAWGRAIVAALASESKAVASAEDVRNRAADTEDTGIVREPPQWQLYDYESWAQYDETHTRTLAAFDAMSREQVGLVKAWLGEQDIHVKWPLPAVVAENLFARLLALDAHATEPSDVAGGLAQAAQVAPDGASADATTAEPDSAQPAQSEGQVDERVKAPSVRDLEKLAGSEEAAKAFLDAAIERVTAMNIAEQSAELRTRSLSHGGNMAERARRLATSMAVDMAHQAQNGSVTPIGAAVRDLGFGADQGVGE